MCIRDSLCFHPYHAELTYLLGEVCLCVDNEMKERLHAYKVATIVLAVVAGIALITIIVLIRYYIVRQRTASQYQLLCFPIVYNYTL